MKSVVRRVWKSLRFPLKISSSCSVELNLLLLLRGGPSLLQSSDYSNLPKEKLQVRSCEKDDEIFTGIE